MGLTRITFGQPSSVIYTHNTKEKSWNESRINSKRAKHTANRGKSNKKRRYSLDVDEKWIDQTDATDGHQGKIQFESFIMPPTFPFTASTFL